MAERKKEILEEILKKPILGEIRTYRKHILVNLVLYMPI